MRKTKKNGCSWPFHPFQFVTYFIISYQVLTTSSLLSPLLTPPFRVHFNQYVFLAVYIPCQVLVIGLGFLATKSDPTDPVVYQHRYAIENKCEIYSESFDSSRYPSVCTICGTSVNSSSKHCGYCNRCVVRFDHHCKWLNNCIGSLNYNLFLGLIGSLEFTEMWLFGASLWLLMQGLSDRSWLEQQTIEVYGEERTDTVLGFIFVLSILSLLVTIVIGNLIGLHVWLRKFKKMTTYEYILHLRNVRKYSTASVSVEQPNHQPGESFSIDAENASRLQLLPPNESRVGRKGTQVVPDLELSEMKIKESFKENRLMDNTKTNSRAEPVENSPCEEERES